MVSVAFETTQGAIQNSDGDNILALEWRNKKQETRNKKEERRKKKEERRKKKEETRKKKAFGRMTNI